MIITKIVLIGLVSCVLIVIVKGINREMVFLISLLAGSLLLSMILGDLRPVIDFIKSFAAKAKLDKEYLYIILKLIGVSYLCEFGASIARDIGENGISNIIEIAGKISIVIIAIPMLSDLFDLVIKLIN